jgi:sporulation integral membrane protein YtvI
MTHFYRRYARTLFDLILLGVTVYLFMVIFSQFFKIATPIFFGIALFFIIEPFASFLHRKGMQKMWATTISTFCLILVIVASVFSIGVIISNEVENLSHSIPKYSAFVEKQIANFTDTTAAKYQELPEGVAAKIKEYATTAISTGSAIITTTVTKSFSLFASFSNFLMNMIFGLILAYFLSLEIDVLKRFFREKTPNTFKHMFSFSRQHVLKGILNYLKAQLILIVITMVCILIPLLIFGIDNAFTIAIASGLCSVIPIVGTSIIFIPWITYLVIVGSYSFALWIGILLLAVVIFCNILEPKLVGKTLGVSAFTMLSAMIISLSLFGVAGVIMSPLLVILLKALYEQGLLKKWIHVPAEEWEDIEKGQDKP